eukprot:TRINITY_DN4680_c0_g1_i3.p1 TRINITY_DN4680_c0_g1~~TRINITY_DN4680_c0_g1_i3.p1  ORF type:complete len:555 (-),score=46.01 TRINITY_DN4680_c0_g1_i3:379-2043(-)
MIDCTQTRGSVSNNTKGKAVVKTSFQAHDLSGKVVVVYDSKGDRLACSVLVPVSLLYAHRLHPYPQSDTRLCVGGQVDVRGSEGEQMISYKLHGIDPSCSTTDELPKNGCGIHIHEGRECADAAGHLHAHDSDPWLSVRYSAEGDRASAWDVKVKTGLHMKDILFRTVVIHDIDGKRISCSKLYPAKHVVSRIVKPYLVTDTLNLVTGDVRVAAYGGYEILSYDLRGVDPKCTDSGEVPNHGCAIRIQRGSSCEVPGSALWDNDEVRKDHPYERVRYYSDEGGATSGHVTMYEGYDLADIVHKFVLIYDYNGKAIACQALQPPPVEDPVCVGKRSTESTRTTVIFVKQKNDECLPSDAVVQTVGGARVELGTVTSGDRVLAKAPSSELSYEPILGFLHSMKPDTTSSLLVVVHEQGLFRATANHMVFVSNEQQDLREKALRDLAVDDFLSFFGESGSSMRSRVIAITEATSDAGLMSPLTRSGTLVADGVVVSSYATSGGASAGHSAMHAAFYSIRAIFSCLTQVLQPSRWRVSLDAASSLAVAFAGLCKSVSS